MPFAKYHRKDAFQKQLILSRG